LKKLFGAVLVALGIMGGLAAAAPPASADHLPTIDGRFHIDPHAPLCLRANVTIFGTRIGTGPEFICP
jgi:hypothetical protein